MKPASQTKQSWVNLWFTIKEGAFESRKLSNDIPIQYLNGWTLRNSTLVSNRRLVPQANQSWVNNINNRTVCFFVFGGVVCRDSVAFWLAYYIKVSEFELQSRECVHFLTNAPGRGINCCYTCGVLRINVTLVLRRLRWYYVGYVGVRYLTPYFAYIIFYPHVVWSGECLAQESPKRIIQKKRQQQIRDEDVFFLYFPLFTAFNNHSMDEGVFSWIHWNGWIPQLRCQNTLNRFM